MSFSIQSLWSMPIVPDSPIPQPTFMEWLNALRNDAEEFGFGSRLDSIPQWMLERVYHEDVSATIGSIILYCETEVGRNYILEKFHELTIMATGNGQKKLGKTG